MLEQQSAIAKILRLVSGSHADAQSIIDTLAESAARLCEAQFGFLYEFDGKMLHVMGHHGLTPDGVAAMRRASPMTPDQGPAGGRAVLSRTVEQIPDVHDDPDYARGRFAETATSRSTLGVPMLKDGVSIGAIVVHRAYPGRFPERQIELLQMFADQAVIATRNAELFEQVKARTRERTHTAGELEALAEVGQTISSTLDVQAVPCAILTHACHLANSGSGAVYAFDRVRGLFDLGAGHNMSEPLMTAVREHPIRRDDALVGQCAKRREPTQIADLGQASPNPLFDMHLAGGVRALLAVPPLHQDEAVGALVLRRRRTGAFAPESGALLLAFATQSAIAIHNARLFQKIYEKSGHLELASRRKSEFLANMSHELRTPLNAILDYAELMQDGDSGDLPDRARGVLERVRSSGRHLLGLINDVLDLSNIEAGQLTLRMDDYSLGDMVQTVVVATESLTAEKRLTLEVELAPNLRGRLGDSLRLRQVLLNLVGNAFKFTEAGEVAVRVTLLEDTLPDDRGKDGRAKLDFSVTDTGTGIPADKVAKLGEAFTQADSSTARKYGGSGLGLAICRKLIAMMGGELVIESEESKGSRFSFAVSFSYVQSGDAATPSMPRNLKGARVLVVEDNSTNRELLGTLFAGFGMRCEMAASAEAAWSSLAAADFDLAVLDWVLPGEDGLTLAGRIRGDRRLQRLPLIMVSSFAGKEEEARAREIGIDAFIPKPITASMLFNGVLEAMKVTSAKQEDPGRQAGIEQEFAGRRLLLAEDNETNQFVANEILLGSGVELDIARNGREAVTMVADRDYDAVLMDMQMPEMDGLEATRIIRRELGGRPLPIIALTANAMQSDLEACRAAGMDDYVAKPIDRKLLFRVLRRWLAKQPVGRVAPSESIAAEIPEPASTDDSRTTARKADEIITDSSEVGSDLGGEEGSTKVSVEEPAPESIEAVEAVLSEPGTGPEPAHNPEPEIKPPAAAPDVAPPEEPDAATPADVSPRKKRARRKKDKSTSQPDLFGAVDFEEEEPGGLQVTIDADGVPVLPGVDMRDAMNRLGLPAEAVQRMVIRFAGGLKRTLGELHAAIESEDRETAQRHAHSIAGAAGNLSADSLRRVAKTLELGLKFEQGNLKAMLADVEREMARIAEGVRQLRSMIDSPEPTEETAAPPPPAELSPADVRRLRTLLEELAASLEEGDYDAIGSVVEKLKNQSLPGELLADYGRLPDMVDAFDYADAAGLVRTMLEKLGDR